MGRKTRRELPPGVDAPSALTVNLSAFNAAVLGTETTPMAKGRSHLTRAEIEAAMGMDLPDGPAPKTPRLPNGDEEAYAAKLREQMAAGIIVGFDYEAESLVLD